MNRTILVTISTAILFTVASCSNTSKQADKQTVKMIAVKHKLGKTEVPVSPKKILVFDMGTLETLSDLGISVAGIPKDFVPAHLKEYKADPNVKDVGSILQPNLEKVSAMNPDLVIISSLHANDYEQLSKIAPTISLGVESDHYKSSVIKNLNTIGEVFDIKEKTNQKVADIENKIEEAAKVIAASPKKIMVLLYNAGSFSSFGSKSRYSFVFSDLKAKTADDSKVSDIHGTVVSSEYISHVNPDILYIIDRNLIMEGHKLNKSEVENALVQKTDAFKNKRIYYLDPNIWYLSGGGTYSIKHMITDVLQGYKL
ncbi:siderophore ABC transporter substrate-binding protein [Pedobacter antarcticus]|uniref:siderophore ABC transporter substrate-binding protein n=1 Tax=Pedobacter antarcticus TaxID=34086 RepID=UPI001C579089|nr:siderophore ABC transporter substrate-binding protein [Pedobacter antarcticus]